MLHARSVLFFGSLLTAQSLAAQSQTPPRWTVNGSIRARYEYWDFFKASAGKNAYGYGATLIRFSVGRQFQSKEFFVEIAQPSLIGLPSDAVAPPPQGQLGFGGTYAAANPDRKIGVLLKQAYITFRGITGDQAGKLKIGRFEFGDGLEVTPEGPLGDLIRDRIANRLIGNFGFTHVGRSLDGVHYSRDTPSANVTFVAARPTEGVFQVHGMKELDIEILYGAFNKTTHAHGTGAGRIFTTYYHDGRHLHPTDNRPLPPPAVFPEAGIGITTIGGNYAHVFDAGAGKTDVLFWGAVQTGHWGFFPHRANAAAVEAGFLFDKTKSRPWIRFGYFRGSGDDNSSITHGTFFQELPTPRPFARFPLYNLMNNKDGFVQVTVRPHERLTLRSEVHALQLAKANDLWYVGGGAFQKQTFGYSGRFAGGHNSLATIFDLSADWRLDSHTSFTIYAAHAAGKGAIRYLFPQGPKANLIYVETTRRF